MNRLAVNIKEARLKAGLSHKELAKKCGLAASFIVQVESGKKIIKEDIAEKILKTLGESPEKLAFDNTPEEEPEAPKVVAKPVKQVSYNFEPNDQWASALSGIIKKYPVHDCETNKIISYKELPILGKKVEGHNPEKIMFVKASNNEASALRIKTGDIITISITKEIQNNGIYLVEQNNTKVIRRLRRENNKVTLYRGLSGEVPTAIDPKKIKVVGKCVKVEYVLK